MKRLTVNEVDIRRSTRDRTREARLDANPLERARAKRLPRLGHACPDANGLDPDAHVGRLRAEPKREHSHVVSPVAKTLRESEGAFFGAADGIRRPVGRDEEQFQLQHACESSS